jgi:aspartyl-tRNA(Asn)/glutamyl-tRNA(Gln) amidotransferase subunit A
VSLARLVEGLRAREFSSREVVSVYLERIEANADLNAYISIRAEEALAEAERTPAGPLHGVPVAVKDVIDVAGTTTTAASRILRRIPPRDATAVARLRAAGAVVLGKLNTHEFAFGATTTSPHFGPAHNPWAHDRICGGSSGGSGAAAAADLAAGTLGTDTAGSIRIPSALCGVTGLRPSIGLVPNDGVEPVSWTVDAVGPIARSAEDCSLLLEALAPEYRPDLDGGLGGLRIGLVEPLLERTQPEVGALARSALDELRTLGARVESAVVPHIDAAGTILQAVMLPEAAQAHLPRLRTRLADYGQDVRTRLLAGLLLPATAHVTGTRGREWFSSELEAAFEPFDLLVHPAMPVVAPPIGEDTVEVGGERLLFRLALIPYNSPWALAGLPVASVPCGFVDGMPAGLALVGRRFDEATVLRAAHAYQRATDWHERRPTTAGTPLPTW